MPRDFIPRRDVDFLEFTINFRAKISPPTDPASLGLIPQQVAHYAITQQAFIEAYKLVCDPGKRTMVSVEGKNAARKALEAETRAMAARIRAPGSVDDATLCGLRLCVPVQRRRHVAAPATAPRMRVSCESGRRVSVQLGDVDAPTLRKPRDAWNADIFAFIGDNPPDDMSHGSGAGGWKYVKSVTRTRTMVTFSARNRPGTKVWLAANWSNWRGERGPICQPMCAHLSYGGPMKEGTAEVSAVAEVESVLRFAPGKAPAPASESESVPLLNAA